MKFLLPLASSIRSDPVVDTLIKILIVVVIGAVAWWIIAQFPSDPPNPFLKIARVVVAVLVGIAVIILLLRLL